MPQEKPNQEDGRLAKKEIEDKEEDIHTRLRNRHDCSKRGKERKNEEANASRLCQMIPLYIIGIGKRHFFEEKKICV